MGAPIILEIFVTDVDTVIDSDGLLEGLHPVDDIPKKPFEYRLQLPWKWDFGVRLWITFVVWELGGRIDHFIDLIR